LLANFIALPLAYIIINKWLQSFAYRVDLSVWIFILSGLAVLVIALLNDYLLIIDNWFHIWYQLNMILGFKTIEQEMLCFIPEGNRKSERPKIL